MKNLEIEETCPVCGKTHTFFVPQTAETDTVLFRCVKAWKKKKATWRFHQAAEDNYYIDVSVNSNYLPHRLKKLRLEADLTEEQLAEMIGRGYNDGFISAVEKGNKEIKIDLLERWASACGKIIEIKIY